jgi:hypothetical protein
MPWWRYGATVACSSLAAPARCPACCPEEL